MKTKSNLLLITLLATGLFGAFTFPKPAAELTLFKNFTLINGTGSQPATGMEMLVEGETITALGKGLKAGDATVVDLQGKTVMPAMINAHVHVGTLKGNKTNAENYTRENILRQLKKYADYGILHVLSMGTDRPPLFENNFYEDVKTGKHPGARMYSAGYGFGVHQGAPPFGPGMDLIYRPSRTEEVEDAVAELAELKVAAVKIWVDNFGNPTMKKMDPVIYKKIIKEAHKHKLKVVSHAYYLSDVRQLVADGIDVIGHSIRDSLIDDALVRQMKAKGVVYIPTLTLDKYSYSYGENPEWINDDFFKRSLEPGVYEMLTSARYKADQKNSTGFKRNKFAYKMALKNLKKIYDGGVTVALGTDSGANPVRTQGFSEHLELELMVKAGLTPLQVISIATKGAAKVFGLSYYGTLQKGNIADFIVLNANPAEDIRNTRGIFAVYKGGRKE